MRGIGAGNEEYFAEVELISSVFSQQQVTPVNRIECAAKYSEFVQVFRAYLEVDALCLVNMRGSRTRKRQASS